MLPLNTNIKEAYAQGQDQEQIFIQNLAMFLCTFLKEHGTLLEKPESNEVLLKVNTQRQNQVVNKLITVSRCLKFSLKLVLRHCINHDM